MQKCNYLGVSFHQPPSVRTGPDQGLLLQGTVLAGLPLRQRKQGTLGGRGLPQAPPGPSRLLDTWRWAEQRAEQSGGRLLRHQRQRAARGQALGQAHPSVGLPAPSPAVYTFSFPALSSPPSALDSSLGHLLRPLRASLAFAPSPDYRSRGQSPRHSSWRVSAGRRARETPQDRT